MLGPPKAQCALSTLRNLVRDDAASVEWLVQNQARGGPITGEYQFPDWERVMTAMGVVHPWVDQNVTFCFETTCNRYISPESRRTHISSLSKLFSCSRRSHKHSWSPSRKVILSQGGRHQVRLGRIRHRSGRPLGKGLDAKPTVHTARQQMLGSGCCLQPYTDNEAVSV